MCGIAGVVKFDRTGVDIHSLKTVSNDLSWRGPDDWGFLGWSGKEPPQISRHPETINADWIALVHRRLAILDLSETGWQPMGTPDGRYYIVFNGEIYNYLELRTQLEVVGYCFHSQTDTEVLLAAYTIWGLAALNRLVGMFAFAILDTQAQKLLLARDFIGIKPLYYTYTENSFAFASEIKPLLQLAQTSRQINPQRLYDYLRYGLTDYGGETLLTNIYQLPAAHYLEIPLNNPSKTDPVRYWQINLNQRLELSFTEAAAQLQKLFLDSLQLHLRSDVPVGAALSGGIDSSSIVMSMRYLQGKNLDLHTFSYIADEPKINEEQWVDLVNHKSEAIAHKIHATPEELVADLQYLISAQGEPVSGTSMYAQYRVFRLAQHTGIKVMLDGQGADELLGGYPAYAGTRLASLIRQRNWSEAISFFQKASQLPGKSRLWQNAGAFLLPPTIQAPFRRLVGQELLPPWLNAAWFAERGIIPHPLRYPQSSDVLREDLHHAVTYMSLPMLLRYEDRNSMTHSIESRVPFLTPDLVNFIFSLPEEYLIAPDGTSKAVFRQAMRGIVPDAILDRQDKIGFSTPEQKWLSHLKPWVDQVLQSEVSQQIPALVPANLEQEWQNVYTQQKPFNFRVWRWINLIEWTRQFDVSYE